MCDLGKVSQPFESVSLCDIEGNNTDQIVGKAISDHICKICKRVVKGDMCPFLPSCSLTVIFQSIYILNLDLWSCPTSSGFFILLYFILLFFLRPGPYFQFDFVIFFFQSLVYSLLRRKCFPVNGQNVTLFPKLLN